MTPKFFSVICITAKCNPGGFDEVKTKPNKNMDQKRKDSIVAKLSEDKYFATVVNQQQKIVEDHSHERADVGEGPARFF